jgi:hypothetical protein
MNHEVSNHLQQLQLLETLGVGEAEGVVEIRGRVNKEMATQWGSFMRNTLKLAKKGRKPYAVDFSRVYYLVVRTVDMPSIPGATGAGPKKLGKMSEEQLVWNWRIKFDSDGTNYLLEECQRLLLLRVKQQMMARGEIPMNPVSVPGIQVVECGTGHPGTGQQED